jgi:BRO family, N-terminal domain
MADFGSMLPNPRPHQQGTLELAFEYDGHSVRCGGSRDFPWFVARDVAEALGLVWRSDILDDLEPDQRGYATICTPGGKQRVAVVYESGLYEMIFKSRKPEAHRFRKWVTSEVLPSIRKTGSYSSKRRERYERLGKDPLWIEHREHGVEARKGLTGTLKEHGVAAPREYAICTNAIYYPTLGGPAATVKQRLGLPAKASLRDNLPLKELMMVGLSELTAQEKIEAENRQGLGDCKTACAVAGNLIANAVKQIARRDP